MVDGEPEQISQITEAKGRHESETDGSNLLNLIEFSLIIAN